MRLSSVALTMANNDAHYINGAHCTNDCGLPAPCCPLSLPLFHHLFKYLAIDADAVAVAVADDDDVELALIVAALGNFDNFLYPVLIASGHNNEGYHALCMCSMQQTDSCVIIYQSASIIRS